MKGYDLPSSHKLAPFRTHTLPYTGPSTVEPKRDEPTHKLAAYTKEFAKLIANEKTLDKIKPSQINQFLRGELFIAADYIITKRNIEGNFEEASTFLLEYLKHGCRLLNICGELLKEVQYFINIALKGKFRCRTLQRSPENCPSAQCNRSPLHYQLYRRQQR
jgi:hypothetical protein